MRGRRGGSVVWRIYLPVLAVTGVAAYLAPIALLERATREARRCLAGFTGARDEGSPRCAELASGFDLPARVPWTAKSAAARREELGARMAIAEYLEAAVGTPDPEALAARAPALDDWGAAIRAGSGRLVLEELGPAIAAPSRGLGAASTGDRRTLIAGYRDWDRWDLQKAALDAALLEGELETATEIAAHYAAGPSGSEDLKTAAAAVLCLGARAGEGLPLLLEVAEKRAAARHEGMARHFGELSIVAMACAARSGAPLPTLPREYGAGMADAIEARAVARIRVSADGSAEALEASLDLAAVLLESEPRPRGLGLWPETPAARPSLVAAMLAADPSLDADRTLDLLRTRDDREATWTPEPSMIATRAWQRPGALLTPVVSAAVLRQAAARLDQMGEAAAASRRLDAAATDLWFRLAILEATLGHPDRAADAIDRGSRREGPSLPAAALMRAVAHRLAGGHADALAALDVPGAGPASLTDDAQAIRLALTVERAGVLAASGRRSDAADLLAPLMSAGISDDAEPLLIAEARWTALALRMPAPDVVLGEPPLGPPPWVGYADRAARWLARDQPGLPESLAVWAKALGASPPSQRAFRYALLERRGDTPPALVPYLFAAGRLLGVEDAEQAVERRAEIETWLDALTAREWRAPSLRAYAWARAEAAQWRGDTEVSREWYARLERLRALAADPALIEITAYLGI